MALLAQLAQSDALRLATELLTTVFIGALSVASVYVTAFFRKARAKAEAEISALENEDAQNLLRAAMEQAETLAESTVQAIEQTVARDLREGVKAGHVQPEELANLGKRAVEEVYKRLKPDYLDALEEDMNELDTYIRSLVESKVLEAKVHSAMLDV